MSSAGRALRLLGCMLLKTCLLTTPKFYLSDTLKPTLLNNVFFQQIHFDQRL